MRVIEELGQLVRIITGRGFTVDPSVANRRFKELTAAELPTTAHRMHNNSAPISDDGEEFLCQMNIGPKTPSESRKVVRVLSIARQRSV